MNILMPTITPEEQVRGEAADLIRFTRERGHTKASGAFWLRDQLKDRAVIRGQKAADALAAEIERQIGRAL